MQSALIVRGICQDCGKEGALLIGQCGGCHAKACRAEGLTREQAAARGREKLARALSAQLGMSAELSQALAAAIWTSVRQAKKK